jgi:ribosome-associated protein
LPAKRPLPETIPVHATPLLQKPAPETTERALEIAGFLDSKQADAIALLDVSGPLVIADYFVVATMRSARQSVAIAREMDALLKQRGQRRRNTGSLDTDEPSWVLLDYDDIVVHLFLAEARAFYDLESLWADVPRLPFTPAPRPGPASGPRPEQPPRRPSGSPFRILPGPDAENLERPRA